MGKQNPVRAPRNGETVLLNNPGDGFRSARKRTPGVFEKVKTMTDWCDNCGLCCMHMRTPPFLGPDDPRWLALPAEMQQQLHDWVMKPSPRYSLMVRHDGECNPCVWLDILTGKCKHYDLRPDVCRDYEVGCDSCRKLRKSVGLTIKGMPVVVES